MEPTTEKDKGTRASLEETFPEPVLWGRIIESFQTKGGGKERKQAHRRAGLLRSSPRHGGSEFFLGALTRIKGCRGGAPGVQ